MSCPAFPGWSTVHKGWYIPIKGWARSRVLVHIHGFIAHESLGREQGARCTSDPRCSPSPPLSQLRAAHGSLGQGIALPSTTAPCPGQDLLLSLHFLLSLHLSVPQAHVCQAGTGPCAKEVTRAQATAFALSRDVVTHTSTHPARADPCPKSLPQLLDLQTLPAALACQISACSSWYPSASASAQGSAPLSFQVGTRLGLGARLAAVGAQGSRLSAWLATRRAWGGELGLPS